MVNFTSLLLTTLGREVLASRVFNDSNYTDLGHTGPMNTILFTTDSGIVSKPIFDIFPDMNSRFDDTNLKLICQARISNFEHYISSGLSSKIASDQRITGIALATETNSVIATIQPTGTSFCDWDYDPISTCMSQKQISIVLEVRRPVINEVGFLSLSYCSVTNDGLKNFMRRVSEEVSVDTDRASYWRTAPYTLVNFGITNDNDPSLTDTVLEKEFYRTIATYTGAPARGSLAKAVANATYSNFPTYTNSNGYKTDMGRSLYLAEFGLTNRDTEIRSTDIMYQGKFAANEAATLTSSGLLTASLTNTPVLYVISVESVLDSTKEFYVDGSWFNPNTGDVYCATSVDSVADIKDVLVDYIYDSTSVLDYLGAAAPKFRLSYNTSTSDLAFLDESACTTQTGINSPTAKDCLRITEVVGNTENFVKIHSAYVGKILIENPTVSGQKNTGLSVEAIDGYGSNPSLTDLSRNMLWELAPKFLYSLNEMDSNNLASGFSYERTEVGREKDIPWWAYTGFGTMAYIGYAYGAKFNQLFNRSNKLWEELNTKPIYKTRNIGEQLYHVYNFKIPSHINRSELEYIILKWRGMGISGGTHEVDFYILHNGEPNGPPQVERSHWERLSDLSYTSESSIQVLRTETLEKPTVDAEGFNDLKYYVNVSGFVTILAISPTPIAKEGSRDNLIITDYIGLGIYEKGKDKPSETFKFREGVDYYYDWYRATAEDLTFITWPGNKEDDEGNITINDAVGESRTLRQRYPVKIANSFQKIMEENTGNLAGKGEFTLQFNWANVGFDTSESVMVTLDQETDNYGVPGHTGEKVKTQNKRALSIDDAGALVETYTSEYYQVGGHYKDDTVLYLFEPDTDINFETRNIYIQEFRDDIFRGGIWEEDKTFEYFKLWFDQDGFLGTKGFYENGGFDAGGGKIAPSNERTFVTNGATIYVKNNELQHIDVSLFDSSGAVIWAMADLELNETSTQRVYCSDNPAFLRVREVQGNQFIEDISILCTSPYKGVDEHTRVTVEALTTVPSFYKVKYIMNDGDLFCRAVLNDGSIKPRIKPTIKDTVTAVIEVIIT